MRANFGSVLLGQKGCCSPFVIVCFYLNFEDDNVDTSNTAVELIASLFQTEMQKEKKRKENLFFKTFNLSLLTIVTGRNCLAKFVDKMCECHSRVKFN